MMERFHADGTLYSQSTTTTLYWLPVNAVGCVDLSAKQAGRVRLEKSTSNIFFNPARLGEGFGC